MPHCLSLCLYIYAAKNLGFEKSPLAYLVLKARNYLIPSAITRGVSYASAGSGILDSTVSHKTDHYSSSLRSILFIYIYIFISSA